MLQARVTFSRGQIRFYVTIYAICCETTSNKTRVSPKHKARVNANMRLVLHIFEIWKLKYDSYNKHENTEINNGNGTEWSPIRSVISNHTSDKQNRTTAKPESDLLITSINTDWIGRHEELIIKLQFPRKRKIIRKKGEICIEILTKDLNYIFECDWLIKLSDNKLSSNKLSNNKLYDNNLASELVENRTFFNQSEARKL